MTVAIVTDSTADIPPEIAETYNIHIVPAIIILPEGQVKDGEGIARRDFYRQLPEMSTLPTTAAPSSGAFEQLYGRLLRAGHTKIVSIHVASNLSGIFNAAHIAAQSFGDSVLVVDSEQVSMGLGFQVIKAAEVAQAGATPVEIHNQIEAIRPRVHVFAMIDTLDYLRRSGRVSWYQAGLGSLLRVKVFLQVQNGEVKRIGETRTRRRGLAQLESILKDLGPLDRLAVLHTDADEDARQFLKATHPDLKHPALIIEATTVIGTHVGPNGVGFAAVVRENPRL